MANKPEWEEEGGFACEQSPDVLPIHDQMLAALGLPKAQPWLAALFDKTDVEVLFKAGGEIVPTDTGRLTNSLAR